MRKILIILALLALSIQTSYAMVAAYCQEERIAASHAAHHEHEEVASSTSSSDSVSYDSDCGVCHLAHSPALNSTFSISIASTALHYEDARVDFLVDISPAPPEKPNWLSLLS
ncbi:cobalt-zinc-cadmium resistance protein [Polynucleobacter sp. MG-27-Goln-C1]|uniref:cobalt-zinc-cadmium resistance protein n=1 Tax=Polynucleobacter sp. MG-27-Goln-C1 TaxID=1819726 RepID=UPI001C0E4EB6|nr:cobalt-zinc-cadmium resistance protein [Polynucleobacter sp. MG-27-Goln-C1]MBU3611285.1 cobalt-zinc-cadmium resistance protein [Polynucleobacter sp. MG-27-Goln-C1]